MVGGRSAHSRTGGLAAQAKAAAACPAPVALPALFLLYCSNALQPSQAKHHNRIAPLSISRPSSMPKRCTGLRQ